MNLQENIQRIRQMMGLITENIDDLLDKMSRGEELSKDEKAAFILLTRLLVVSYNLECDCCKTLIEPHNYLVFEHQY